MVEINIKQMPAFKRAYKKLHEQEKLKVNAAIREILRDPTLGQEKRGDLAGVYVYELKFITKRC